MRTFADEYGRLILAGLLIKRPAQEAFWVNIYILQKLSRRGLTAFAGAVFRGQIRASLLDLIMTAKKEIEQDLKLTDLGFSSQV